MMTTCPSDPLGLVIVADESGDLWRVVENVGVYPIRSSQRIGSWDRLKDWRKLCGLEPSMALVATMDGRRFNRIRFRFCIECDGTGERPTGKVVADADGHGNVEYEAPRCEWCGGQGWTPEWAEEVQAVEVLGSVAGLLL